MAVDGLIWAPDGVAGRRFDEANWVGGLWDFGEISKDFQAMLVKRYFSMMNFEG